jgi:hypothetical protein
MALSKALEIQLKKQYAPSSLVDLTFKGNDMAIKTDPDGNAVVLFIGRKGEAGHIKGERYVRTPKKDNTGKVIKDHWELQGKV